MSPPASSPWQRAGDYFRCCKGSGLTRVSVLLSHAVRAAAAAALLPRWELLSRAGRGRCAGCPFPGAVVKERTRRPSFPRSRVGPAPAPFPALAPAWRPHSSSGEGLSVCGSPRCPSPTVQSPAAGFSKAEARRAPRVCALALRGPSGSQQPRV